MVENLALSPQRPFLTGIGNVILDRSVTLSHDKIKNLGYPLGATSLIDDTTAKTIAQQFAWQNQSAGGSVANSMTSMAVLAKIFASPFSVKFQGHASDDEPAVMFEESFANIGGRAILHKTQESHTGQCFCLVDEQHGERTMLTNLGSNVFFNNHTLDDATLDQSGLIFLEGYLFDSNDSKNAFQRVLKNHKKTNGALLALTLSDPFCVERHGGDFLTLIKQGIDIVFANEAEIIALTKSPDMEMARQKIMSLASDNNNMWVITKSAKGVEVFYKNQEPRIIATTPNPSPKDTTGAGDQLAAGFLFSIAHGFDIIRSAKLGCLLAGEVIKITGAHPPINKDLLTRHGIMI